MNVTMSMNEYVVMKQYKEECKELKRLADKKEKQIDEIITFMQKNVEVFQDPFNPHKSIVLKMPQELLKKFFDVPTAETFTHSQNQIISEVRLAIVKE